MNAQPGRSSSLGERQKENYLPRGLLGLLVTSCWGSSGKRSSRLASFFIWPLRVLSVWRGEHNLIYRATRRPSAVFDQMYNHLYLSKFFWF